jgi:hypothetical protein
MLAVPIYDARKVTDVLFPELVLSLDRLPHIYREIPHDSCAVVGYTANTWGRDETVNISFNIKWVVVLGVPGHSR